MVQPPHTPFVLSLGSITRGKFSARDQVVQGSCGCPLPGSAQGQAGWEFEQPDVVHLMSLPMAGVQN